METGASYKADPPKSQLTASNSALCRCDPTLPWLREMVPGTTVGLIGPMSSSGPRLGLAWCGSDLRAWAILGQCVCHSKQQNCQACSVLAVGTCLGSRALLTLCGACLYLCLSSYHCTPSPASGPLVDLHTAISVHPSCPLLRSELGHALCFPRPEPCPPCVVNICLLTTLWTAPMSRRGRVSTQV